MMVFLPFVMFGGLPFLFFVRGAVTSFVAACFGTSLSTLYQLEGVAVEGVAA